LIRGNFEITVGLGKNRNKFPVNYYGPESNHQLDFVDNRIFRTLAKIDEMNEKDKLSGEKRKLSLVLTWASTAQTGEISYDFSTNGYRMLQHIRSGYIHFAEHILHGLAEKCFLSDKKYGYLTTNAYTSNQFLGFELSSDYGNSKYAAVPPGKNGVMIYQDFMEITEKLMELIRKVIGRDPEILRMAAEGIEKERGAVINEKNLDSGDRWINRTLRKYVGRRDYTETGKFGDIEDFDTDAFVETITLLYRYGEMDITVSGNFLKKEYERIVKAQSGNRLKSGMKLLCSFANDLYREQKKENEKKGALASGAAFEKVLQPFKIDLKKNLFQETNKTSRKTDSLLITKVNSCMITDISALEDIKSLKVSKQEREALISDYQMHVVFLFGGYIVPDEIWKTYREDYARAHVDLHGDLSNRVIRLLPTKSVWGFQNETIEEYINYYRHSLNCALIFALAYNHDLKGPLIKKLRYDSGLIYGLTGKNISSPFTDHLYARAYLCMANNLKDRTKILRIIKEFFVNFDREMIAFLDENREKVQQFIDGFVYRFYDNHDDDMFYGDEIGLFEFGKNKFKEVEKNEDFDPLEILAKEKITPDSLIAYIKNPLFSDQEVTILAFKMG
jgi:hypothetical protein